MDNSQRRPPQIFRHTVRVVAQRDWLGSLIGVTRVISELAPFPVSSVASIVLLILEPLENLKHNRRLFRDLAEKVVHITMGLRAEVVADESAATSPRFVQTCLQFIDCLSSVAEDLKDIFHRRSWVNQYFSAHSIRPTIFNAQKRVDGLIESFMLTTAVGTRLGVQSIRTDLRIMRSALTPPSSDTGAEPEFRDFHKLIPGDLQLIPPPRPVPSAEIPEGHIEYPVLVGGVRMTARIYRGENASQQWREDFHLFSSIRNPWAIQLFGYCESPRQLALVFHYQDEPLPDPDTARPNVQALGCGCHACGCGT